jgi:hypothetical protein
MGPLKRPSPERVEQAIRSASTLRELFTALGYPANQHRFIQGFADGKRLAIGDPLSEADEITLLLPMGGG